MFRCCICLFLNTAAATIAPAYASYGTNGALTGQTKKIVPRQVKPIRLTCRDTTYCFFGVQMYNKKMIYCTNKINYLTVHPSSTVIQQPFGSHSATTQQSFNSQQPHYIVRILLTHRQRLAFFFKRHLRAREAHYPLARDDK